MEQPKTKQYKLYGSKVPIWWNKMSENRPAYDYFHSFDFQWIELPINMGYVNQFRGHLVLKEDTWTYFKMVHIPTNKVTYWFVDDIIYIMEKGHNYALGLDLWSSYNMNIIKNLPDNLIVGVERTHLPIRKYFKYNRGGVIDDLLIGGSKGNYALEVSSAIDYNGSNEINIISYDWKTNSTNRRYYRSINDNNPKIKGFVSCYVFTNWAQSESEWVKERGKQYLIFPVLIQKNFNQFWMKIQDTTIYKNIAFGNTEKGLQFLVRKHTNSFIGIFLLPIWKPSWEFTTHYETISDSSDKVGSPWPANLDTYEFHFRPIGFYEFDESFWEDTALEIKTRWGYNDYNIDLTYNQNCYTFVNSNNLYFNNLFTPVYTWNVSGLSYKIKGGFNSFNNGFLVQLNRLDAPCIVSGPLPSNKEAYATYVNGIRESMNTAIKVSQDNRNIGIARGVFGAVIGASQTAVSGILEDPLGVAKGIANTGNSIMNLAGSIVNHNNTKATFDAQLKDAKNSIPESIADSNSQDLQKYIWASDSKATSLLIKDYTTENIVTNNNLAFLFGVKVQNDIPWEIINNTFKKDTMPMIYIEFQKAFLETTMDQYLTKQFPTMNQTLRRALLDGFRIGYRIWKVKCDLTGSYMLDVGLD